jgi:hypothetical protein
MLGRMAEMLDYAGSEAPAVLRAAPPLPPRVRPADASRGAPDPWLAPGRAVGPLRLPLAWLQPLLSVVLLPLVGVGALVLARRDWRRAALLLSVSVYYLLSESPFIYEWRVVAPMHYGFFAAAGAALVAGWTHVRRLVA